MIDNIVSLGKEKRYADLIAAVLQGADVNIRDETDQDQFTILLYCAFNNEPELFSWFEGQVHRSHQAISQIYD